MRWSRMLDNSVTGMDILILYVEIMPYNLPVWRYLRDKGHRLTVVQYDKRKLTPFCYEGESGIEVHNVSSFADYNAFKDKFYRTDCQLLLMCECFHKWYWRLARCYHKHHPGMPVVLGCDAQWEGKRNNYIKKFLFPFSYARVFTHIQCAGSRQVDYAMRIGFRKAQVITPFYCAQNDVYYAVDIERKREAYPRRFLFVGRLNEVKGIREMLAAWGSIKDRRGWTLTLVGNGPLEAELEAYRGDVDILPFMQQQDIAALMQESGCSMVPSRHEPWGLVIHEAAAAGMPLIVSSVCGATDQFVADGVNGIVLHEVSASSIRQAMQQVIAMTSEQLLSMSHESRMMSKSIQPCHVAGALLGLMKNI